MVNLYVIDIRTRKRVLRNWLVLLVDHGSDLIDIFEYEFRELDPEDLFYGVVGLGVPDAFKFWMAIAEEDKEESIYRARVIGTSYAMLYTAYQGVVLWDIYRHGGKNVVKFTFRNAIAGKGALGSQVMRSPLMLPLYAAESAYYQNQVWSDIGDPVTGAVHYSGAGLMSGGSMPVVNYQPPGGYSKPVDDWMSNVWNTLTLGW